MGFNFPNNPTNGQTYTPAGGYQYVYLDGVWRVVEAPQDVGTAQTRNRIVNGAMQVSQENGNTAGTTTPYYPADQWYMQTNLLGQFGTQRLQVVTANGSRDRLLLTCQSVNTPLNVAAYALLVQPVEGSRIADFAWGTPYARSVVVRFWLNTPAAGTYGFALRNAAGALSYVAPLVVAAGQVGVDMMYSIAIPGPTTGTWPKDTASSLLFSICVAAGTNWLTAPNTWAAGNFLGPTGMINGAAVNGASYNFADVGLYCDPLATGIAPPWVMPDEAEELQACQRYWHRVGAWFNGNITSGQTYYSYGAPPVEPRMLPAMSGTNVSNTGFPATAGTIDRAVYTSYREGRTANATSPLGYFFTNIIANARM